MCNKITLEMSICQAGNGFSLDELVKKEADSYEKKAFADILKMNLQLIQEVLMYRIFDGKSFAPLAIFIGLERYQTKNRELEKLVVEAASGTIYRRAVNDLKRDGKS